MNHTHICESVAGKRPLQRGREVGRVCTPVLEHLVGAMRACVRVFLGERGREVGE